MVGGNKGAGHRVLELLVERKACLTLDAIQKELGLPRNRITTVICRMVTQKFVTREEQGCYQSTAAGRKALEKGYTSGPHRPLTGTRPPARNSYRQRLWTTLRLRRIQSTPDLVANARGPKDREKQAFLGAYKYLNALAAAGIVTKQNGTMPGTTPTSNGFAIWRLAKDLGPLAPVFNEDTHIIRDPNVGGQIYSIGSQA